MDFADRSNKTNTLSFAVSNAGENPAPFNLPK